MYFVSYIDLISNVLIITLTKYTFRIPLNRCNAMTARDTMVKSIYKHLFQFLVSEMNKTHSETVTSKYIAILDIAGFGSS